MKAMFLRFVSKTLISESTESRVQIFAEEAVYIQEAAFVLSTALRGVS